MFDPEQFQLGRNFVWFFGVVEDRIDPNYLGRVRVRCFGFHTDNRELLPTEDLPWAMVMQPTNSAAQTEVGQSPTGLVDGSWVVGFFLDGEEAQQPMVIGSVGGYAKRPENLSIDDSSTWSKTGFKDVREDINLMNKGFPKPPEKIIKRKGTNLGAEIIEDSFVEKYPREEDQDDTSTMRLARGYYDERNFHDTETSLNTSIGKEKKLFKGPLGSKKLNENQNIDTSQIGFSYDQPTSPYNAMYPYNHVRQTESGHIVEYDDTPNAERIHEYHRSGTFREIHPSGKSVTQNMDEQYNLTESNSYEYVKGSKYETYKQGLYQLINAAEIGGADARVEVAGSANYVVILDKGNYSVLASAGNAQLAAKQELMLYSGNEIRQTAHLLKFNGGNLKSDIENDITLESGGMIQTKTGSQFATTQGNFGVEAGDNFQVRAQHSMQLLAENSILNPNLNIPVPIAIEQTARFGNIEINAQDGDSKIVSRALGQPFDQGSVVVTSALPTSITSLAQPQPAPELTNIHSAFPASIVAQTKTGYIYLLSTIGNIVLETQTANDIKLKTKPIGKIESIGGAVKITSTMIDVDITSQMDTIIDAGFGFYSSSKIASEIKSSGEVYVKSGLRTEIKAQTGASLHTVVGTVTIGQDVGSQPAIKGQAFLNAFLTHTHLTPMGPTSPVNQADGIVFQMQNSFCTKTFVF